MPDFDLFVIGAGSGGVRASRIAASHGAKVACAEDGKLGGTCVNVGCVPKKLFVYGSHFRHDAEDAKAFGWDLNCSPEVAWNRLIDNKDEEILRLNGIYRNLLEKAGVTLIEGHATLKDAHTVSVEGRDYTAEKILIAAGSWPFVPDFPGSEFVITSNEAFYLHDLPKRVCVVGGGYIGVEFACIFNGYGSDVTLAYRGDLFLRGFDDDVRHFLAKEMRAKKIDVRFQTNIVKIAKDPTSGTLTAHFQDDTTAVFDCIMYATGRKPKVEGLGLERIGIETGKNGEIKVDAYSRTNIPSIFAVGDVTDRKNLTPVALAEGHCFADTEFGGKQRSVTYEAIPTAVFSQPAIGTCGLTEMEAREKFNDDIDIYKSEFRALKHTLSKREERVFMKIVVQRSTDLVIGVHVVEPSAGEVIQLVGVAMKAGATKSDFDSTIGVHPTSAEEMVTMRSKA